MTYKMLVLDIDDTLLNSQHEISPKTFKRLIEFQEAGNYLVLASGRPTASMFETADLLKLNHFNSHIISFNGAVVSAVASRTEIFSQRMDVDEQQEVIDFIQANDLAVIAYTEDGIKVDRENEYSHIEGELTGLPWEYDEAYFKSITQPQLKFIGVGDPTICKQLEQDLGGRYGKQTNAVTSKPYFLEFMHEASSKGSSLERLCEHLGIDISQTIACGDGNNDLTMIETAGLGVAMGNATETLKKAADYITASNDEDGIVQVIDKFF
ncbi:Cof-type HAD-IIB family hydrolase [Fundicoccus ignavus]|uniref:Cof-type HAD-IIB family hydrolase n=1 Tax=Fundicoccus ignavus TaxID=2664442 RepID=A0A844CII4_9LACT|nr:Cof-type HAD-IIB family hydrolase [Fundicoccus ignavus]MRJ47495.1 Cof-type HAD-IIB family hydrolase [Fundicoccus ignavus]